VNPCGVLESTKPHQLHTGFPASTASQRNPFFTPKCRLFAPGLPSVPHGTLNRGPVWQCRPRTGQEAFSTWGGELSTGGIP
jgi:hypothetical protein